MKLRTMPVSAIAGIAALLMAAFAAHAANTNGVTRLALVAASATHDGGPVLAGIDMELAKGWKTYWREPGESGIAPVFDWSASENVAGVELRWPAPERFDDPGDITFGYRNAVLLPLRVVPQDPSLPVMLRLSMQYGVCSASICVPREDELTLSVPAGTPEDGIPEEIVPTRDALRLQAALARVPVPPADPDMITVGWIEDAAPTLEVRLAGCGTGCPTPALIIDGPDNVWFGTPETSRDGDQVLYRIPVEVLSTAMLDGAELALILSSPERALIVRKTVQ